MEFAGTITKHDPPGAHSIEMIGQAFDIVADYTFENLGDGRTQVTQVSEVTGKGLTRVMLFLMGGMAKKHSCDALDKELQSLKALCESSA